jgi:hypothetical protein
MELEVLDPNLKLANVAIDPEVDVSLKKSFKKFAF